MDTPTEILRVIDNHQRFVISTHINPDGDAIGSQLALYSWLKDLGKQVWAVNRDPVPAVYTFLPFAAEISVLLPVELTGLETKVKSCGDVISCYPPSAQVEHPYACDYTRNGESAEVLIVVDAGDLQRIGMAKEKSFQGIIINIDHHVTNTCFGNYNLVDMDASASAIPVYKLIKQCGINIGLKRAICLYTGIMGDTGCFRFANTNPEAHRIAAELISEGVPVDEIYQRVYETLSSNRVRLLGLVLNTLQLSLDDTIGWIHVTQDMYVCTGTSQEDTESFIDYVRTIDTVEVAAFFVELKDGNTKVSLRAQNTLDVSKIAIDFGGGGHSRAAGCTITAPLNEAKQLILSAIQQRFVA